MKLPIDRVKTQLSFTEIAAFLSGQRMEGVDMGYQISDETIQCRRYVVEAVELGDLPGHIVYEGKPPSEGYEGFFPEGPWGQFENHDVVEWLCAIGVAKEDIAARFPSYIGAMPDKPSGEHPELKQRIDKRLNPKREHSLYTLAEGLALEAMDGGIPEKPYKAAGIVQGILECHGLKLDNETIAAIIREIQAIRAARLPE